MRSMVGSCCKHLPHSMSSRTPDGRGRMDLEDEVQAPGEGRGLRGAGEEEPWWKRGELGEETRVHKRKTIGLKS